MNESGYTSIFTTYNKESAVLLISALRENEIKLMYRTSTETGSDDVLYEICVRDRDVDNSHNILFNLKLNDRE